MKNLLIALLMVFSVASFAQDNETKYREALIAFNKNVVTEFYKALERKDYKPIKEIIDVNGIASISGSDTLEGRDAIASQFKSSVDGFYKVKFSTKVNDSADPTTVIVKVKNLLESADGTKVEKVYLATFKFKNGKIVEYTQYENSPASARS